MDIGVVGRVRVPVVALAPGIKKGQMGHVEDVKKLSHASLLSHALFT